MSNVYVIVIAFMALFIFGMVVRINQLDTVLYDQHEEYAQMAAKVAEIESAALEHTEVPKGITETCAALKKQVNYDLCLYLGVIKDLDMRVRNLEDIQYHELRNMVESMEADEKKEEIENVESDKGAEA